MKITVELLKEFGACQDQIDLFVKTFPDGAEPTRENVMRAFGGGLDVGWLAQMVLPQPARAEYNRITQPAWAEYLRIIQPARAEFERIEQPARAEFERITQPVRAEYLRIEQPARAEFERITQPALAEIFERYLSTPDAAGV